jgi:hypothetical protein
LSRRERERREERDEMRKRMRTVDDKTSVFESLRFGSSDDVFFSWEEHEIGYIYILIINDGYYYN